MNNTNNTSADLIQIRDCCEWILVSFVENSWIRYWDIFILIPNVIFALFLLYKLKSNLRCLQLTRSAIFTTFYIMVWIVVIIGIIRSVVSMLVNASVPIGDATDKLLWLLLKFCLLSIELSVIVFGLAFGHLGGTQGITRTIFVTSLFALIYSSLQGTFEFLNPDTNFTTKRANTNENYLIFSHGGMIFLFISSALLFIMYFAIGLFPIITQKLQIDFPLPTKRLFYYYCYVMALFNFVQAIGSLFFYLKFMIFLCVVNFTSLFYFTALSPMIYITFLKDFFKDNSSFESLMISYDRQEDENSISSNLNRNVPVQEYDNIEKVLADDNDSTHFIGSSLQVNSLFGDFPYHSNVSANVSTIDNNSFKSDNFMSTNTMSKNI